MEGHWAAALSSPYPSASDSAHVVLSGSGWTLKLKVDRFQQAMRVHGLSCME